MTMTDQEYINNYKQSRERVNRFAYITLKSNVNISLLPQPPLNIREQDQGDLMFFGRIEHKVRDLDFTCREDYKYQTVIIDEKYKIENKNDKVFMYIIENKSGTHAAIVYGFTRSLWRISDFYDWKRSKSNPSYHIDKSHVRFCKIEEVF